MALEDKIEASKAEEQRLTELLASLPGHSVTDEAGENVLALIERQQSITWNLLRLARRFDTPDTFLGLPVAQQAQQAVASPAPSDLFVPGLATDDGLAKLAEPAEEPEPPTLTATEVPAPVAEPAEEPGPATQSGV
jgi:hypothetical protein